MTMLVGVRHLLNYNALEDVLPICVRQAVAATVNGYRAFSGWLSQWSVGHLKWQPLVEVEIHN